MMNMEVELCIYMCNNFVVEGNLVYLIDSYFYIVLFLFNILFSMILFFFD